MPDFPDREVPAKRVLRESIARISPLFLPPPAAWENGELRIEKDVFYQASLGKINSQSWSLAGCTKNMWGCDHNR
ncbi:hypothetical protein KKI24_23190, partial [bacterium]|nr:hypothetical protein [bacterium]